MIAALILISLLALAGACFPDTSPCISNLRQHWPSVTTMTSLSTRERFVVTMDSSRMAEASTRRPAVNTVQLT